ncbi:hypothetical protein Salat_2892100 [Sesamum alatum]|uniref:CCHC-type domain-containing protein n=1 Tax=Sesamum alatum TaxID=300844 RepID=A0AAE1XIC9_9LAMI|nr:hypothetical protein Salat_2892100 [Sesamum alatum]
MADDLGDLNKALSFSEDENLSVMLPMGVGKTDVEQQGFYMMNFHVHIHDLPLSRMAKEIAAFIGNQLGMFRDVELDKGGQGWGSSLCIRVSLDVNKHLKRIMKMHSVMGNESVISFTYERLPNFCYWCGRLGHITKLCDSQYEEGFNDKQEHLPFGPWLQASTPSILRSRGLMPPAPRTPFLSATHTPPPPQNTPLWAAIVTFRSTKNLYHFSFPHQPSTSRNNAAHSPHSQPHNKRSNTLTSLPTNALPHIPHTFNSDHMTLSEQHSKPTLSNLSTTPNSSLHIPENSLSIIPSLTDIPLSNSP